MQNSGYRPHDRLSQLTTLLLQFGTLTLLLVCLTLPGLNRAEPSDESKAAIQHLLDYVRQSDLVFVRNFSSHSSADAAEHISEKYDHFRKEIATPEEFIELCASKSLLTGKAYLVIDDQGREIATRDWLLIELAAYRTQNGQLQD